MLVADNHNNINMVTGTLARNRWVVTFGRVKRSLIGTP